MFRDLTLLTLAGQRMDWVAKRQEVLAQNVANADTPDYRPKDVKAFDFQDVMRQIVPPLKLARTSAQHLTPPLRPIANVITNRRSDEVAPDGNGVNLEQQMAAIGESDDVYGVSASLYEKQYRMMRLSIGNRGQE